jgi:hypothetical protein
MISEMHKYCATMFAINFGMILLYVFSTYKDCWYLIVLSVIFHVLTVTLMLVLAWVDPGIIPKIFSDY